MEYEPWVEYARLQAILDRTTDARKGAGIEAAMTELVEKIGCGDPPKAKQVRNLVTNRVGKERRRRAILVHRRYTIIEERGRKRGADGANMPCGAPQTSETEADCRLTLLKCLNVCGRRDFALMIGQAQGYTYGELATVTGERPSALKTRVHRARKQILALAA